MDEGLIQTAGMKLRKNREGRNWEKRRRDSADVQAAEAVGRNRESEGVGGAETACWGGGGRCSGFGSVGWETESKIRVRATSDEEMGAYGIGAWARFGERQNERAD